MSLVESFNKAMQGCHHTLTLMLLLKRIGLTKSYKYYRLHHVMDYSVKIYKSNDKLKL